MSFPYLRPYIWHVAKRHPVKAYRIWRAWKAYKKELRSNGDH